MASTGILVGNMCSHLSCDSSWIVFCRKWNHRRANEDNRPLLEPLRKNFVGCRVRRWAARWCLWRLVDFQAGEKVADAVVSPGWLLATTVPLMIGRRFHEDYSGHLWVVDCSAAQRTWRTRLIVITLERLPYESCDHTYGWIASYDLLICTGS